jgi:tetratricopeptide (TPR) repeat protein
VLAAGIVGAGLLSAGCSSGSGQATQSPISAAALAVEDIKAHNYPQASALLHQIIENPQSSTRLKGLAYYDLGVIAQDQHRTGLAIYNYHRSTVYTPPFAPAYFNLAIAQTPRFPDAALANYDKVLALKPGDVNALFNSGLILVRKGDPASVASGTQRIKQAIAARPSLASRVPSSVHLG